MKVHPLAEAIPEMLTDEYADLVADIKANGLQQPLTLLNGMILDGRHRARACADLGITPNSVPFTGTEAEAKAYVLSLNVQRRHLTLAQKHGLIRAELQRDPTQSDRTIAKKAKVSDKTVAAARAKAEEGAEIPHHDERVGADGVKQPAKKAPKKRPIPKLSDREYRESRQLFINSVIARCIKSTKTAAARLLGTEEIEQLRAALGAVLDQCTQRAGSHKIARLSLNEGALGSAP